MTLYRKFFINTRPYWLATATGAVLCSCAVFAEAQQSASPAYYPHPRANNRVEPQHLPQSVAPVRALPETLQLIAAETPAAATGQPSSRSQMQQASSQEEPRSGGFGERLSRLFRGRPATSPPVDPGMHYPKASDVVAGPPPAPGASGTVIPSIPPTYGNPSGQPEPSQPALFAPANTVNAIGTNHIPPAPGTERVASPPQQVANTPPATEIPLQNIPELKALMMSEDAPVAATPKIAQEPHIPNLNLDAPLPGTIPQIAPGEPSGTAATPAATTASAAPMAPAIPAAPEVNVAQETKKKDPFADLFPEDQASPAAEQPDAMVQAKTPSQGPYTGLSLEPNNDIPALEILPPPPLEEEVKVATKLAPSTKPAPKLEIKSASLPKLSGPPPAPGVPPEELKAPQDLPQVASKEIKSIETPSVSLKPVDPQPAQPQSPPSTTEKDQKSKLERIAARKGLKGLKGFCPVVLRDDRDLVDSSAEYTVSYNGRDYALSSSEAKIKFLDDPAKYAPAAAGCDVIHLALTGERQEGSLEHAVWYKGRLYLFSGVETMETFVAAPSSHATDE